MSYEKFQSLIGSLVKKSGGGISVDFRHTEDGKYIARVSDGTVITGNPASMRVAVRWGGKTKNHQGMAIIA